MKVAVAVDGSDNAMRAAKHAIMLATYLPDTSLEVIMVIDLDKVKDEYLLTQSAESLRLKRERKVHPIIELASKQQIDVETTILKGKPSQEIIQYVNKNAIDQLVVGSRGLNSFQEMIVGSVSHRVMKYVKCPVTIVK
ncbi:universal stress protein [Sporosarcina pasteurii]|uniref:Universal stress protein SAV1710 n=1 Tax=Sporosarcina pasteurii TaxID=1474 RepID=A0A380BW42_SPOPA|nr:universal stress protein [Sporosarcina pasteurii]MDS9471371.1 universal stress protein [Sporosarcina pasteurii]QBQ05001.1 universal stress protein [Sporosarcina pasteurii]SUJ08153.1 Putative universal stress protein SAV1710 [Sporosarcina pasteurii]